MHIVVLSDLYDCLPRDLKIHSMQTSMLSEVFAAAFEKELTESYTDLSREEIYNAVKLGGFCHDFGKIMFSELLLFSPSELTDAERAAVKWHPVRSAEIIDSINDFSDLNPTVRTIVKECCLYHHERFDGNGYPYGLTAKAIPMVSQIVSLCDVLDALCSKRSYKEGYSFEKSCRIIIEQKEKSFSGDIIDRFCENIKILNQVYEAISYVRIMV